MGYNLVPHGSRLTIEDPDVLLGIFQSPGNGMEIIAPIHVPLHIILFSRGSKASESVPSIGANFFFRALFGSEPILSVTVGVDGSSQLFSKLVTEICNGILELIQEAGDLIGLGISSLLLTLTRLNQFCMLSIWILEFKLAYLATLRLLALAEALQHLEGVANQTPLTVAAARLIR